MLGKKNPVQLLNRFGQFDNLLCASHPGWCGNTGFVQLVGVGFLHLYIAAVGIDQETAAVGSSFDESEGGAAEAEEIAALLSFFSISEARPSFHIKKGYQFT